MPEEGSLLGPPKTLCDPTAEDVASFRNRGAICSADLCSAVSLGSDFTGTDDVNPSL